MRDAYVRIPDEEQLYRRVPKVDPAGTLLYSVSAGKLKFSSSAFNDRSKRPSVERAELRNSNPHGVRKSTDDGVVLLAVAAVRGIPSIPLRSPGQPPVLHVPDVAAVPLLLNYAHAEISTVPQIVKSGTFGKLKEALARIAEASDWKIRPETPLPSWKVRFTSNLYHGAISIYSFLRRRLMRLTP